MNIHEIKGEIEKRYARYTARKFSVIFVLLVSLIALVISVVPIAGALYETKTDDGGIYTLSNLPPGTYTITAIAIGPPEKIVKILGIKRFEIMVEMNKKLNTIPVDPGEGTGSISGKVLFNHPYLKMVI